MSNAASAKLLQHHARGGLEKLDLYISTLKFLTMMEVLRFQWQVSLTFPGL